MKPGKKKKPKLGTGKRFKQLSSKLKKKGGRITYRMTGGQVVSHGYD